MKYEYKCQCSVVFETNHSMTVNNAVEELGLVCPSCGSKNIKKYLGNINNPAILFKGTGWASVDGALDRIGMPKNIRDNLDTKEAIRRKL